MFRRIFLASVITTSFLIAQTETPEPQSPPLPPSKPLEVPARIGVFGETTIGLAEVIQRVLANDRDIAISQIARQEAVFNIKSAKGYFDPRLGLNAHRLKSVTPISSSLGGAANGKLAQKELYADPQLSGSSPWLGTTYRLDFASARQFTDNEFASLNPLFPTSVNLNLTQPLWRGLRYDDNRHRLQVSRKNQQLTEEQFRQRVIEVSTQAIQAFWELVFAHRNFTVQLQAVRLAEQQDASNRRQVQQGLLAPADVIQTQTQIANFQQTLFAAQEALTRAENNLKTLILPSREDLMWGVALVPEAPQENRSGMPTLQDATRAALAFRPELAESDVNVALNELDARLSRELAKPQIDAVGTFSLQGLAGRPIPAGPNPFTGGFIPLFEQINQLSTLAGLPPLGPISFGSTTIPPIFVGGYSQSVSALTSAQFPIASVGLQISLPIRNRTASANAAISALEGKRLQTVRSQVAMAIEADVRNALQTVSSAQARLDSAVLARQSADEQYASEQRQFQAGTSSVFLVLQRQAELVAARSREIRAQADLGQADADLDRATARTLEVRNIKLASVK